MRRKRKCLFLMAALAVALLGALVLATVAGATTDTEEAAAASVQAAPHAWGEKTIYCVYRNGCLVYGVNENGTVAVRLSHGSSVSGVAKIRGRSIYYKTYYIATYYYYGSDGWVE